MSVILDPKIRNGTSDTRNNHYFYKDRLKQLKEYFHFCDPNVPVPVMNDPALDRLHKIRPVVSILQEQFETLYYPHKEISVLLNSHYFCDLQTHVTVRDVRDFNNSNV